MEFHFCSSLIELTENLRRGYEVMDIVVSSIYIFFSFLAGRGPPRRADGSLLTGCVCVCVSVSMNVRPVMKLPDPPSDVSPPVHTAFPPLFWSTLCGTALPRMPC